MSEPPRPSVVTSNVGRDALEAGDEHDRVLRRAPRGSGGRGRRRSSPCRATVSVTIPACEPVSEIASLAEVVDRHRREGAGDALADRDQHVELARRRATRETSWRGEVEQLVGRVAHRREHADDAASVLAGGDEAARDGLESFGVGDGRAAELHHHGAELRGALGRRDRGKRAVLRWSPRPDGATVLAAAGERAPSVDLVGVLEVAADGEATCAGASRARVPRERSAR